jgi:hypothetical protein
MIIQNQMVEYAEERMPYLLNQEVAAQYMKRRRIVKQAETPCIKPVNQALGGRFHAKG